MPITAPGRKVIAACGATAVAIAGLVAAGTATSTASPTPQALAGSTTTKNNNSANTTTPIKHVVVIYDENISYDHYFGTYPQALNTDGGTPFTASKDTPKNNNLITSGLLTKNPNLYPPSRLTPAEIMTCDQNHNYGPEQKAMDGGKMDLFVQNVSVDTCTGEYGAPGLSMDYYDGNTVTGLWNYAQQFSLSDNSYGSTFGPSTPGALNLIAGQTHGFKEVDSVTGKQVPTPGSYVLASPDSSGVGTVINDPDPAFDDCSDANHTSVNTLAAATGHNVGDLLNTKGVTWGWFQGGFRPTTPASSTAKYSVCGAKHTNFGGASVVDYSAHHNPFEYYASTSNPHHLPPSATSEIGYTDQANHEYDLTDFDAALTGGSLPAVSFLKAGEYQDGHAGYSDPIDEQNWLTSQINAIQESPYWKDTAIVVAYDDSDGWYDHQAPVIKNASHDAARDAAICDNSTQRVAQGYQDRCGPGPRLPLLVMSPYSKANFVDHSVTTQSSITRFVEDNWKTGHLGDGSFDAGAGVITNMFDFNKPNNKQVLLNSNGAIKSITPIG